MSAIYARLKIRPITVPNYVTLISGDEDRGDSMRGDEKIPVRDLDVQAIEALAAQFRRDLFERAGKQPTTSPLEQAIKRNVGTVLRDEMRSRSKTGARS
tara:strand:- start:1581 stop:1877 length:297 start_codon:yes stop_codon:yes gene_type:complete